MDFVLNCNVVCAATSVFLHSLAIVMLLHVSEKWCIRFYNLALMLFVWRQEGHPTRKRTEWWDAGMVICLGRGADFHMAQLMPLPLIISCSSKSRLVVVYLSGTGSPWYFWTKSSRP